MSGPSVAGGGTIAVETDEMLRASSVLVAAKEELQAVTARTAACAAVAVPPDRRAHVEDALLALRRAAGIAERAAEGLRLAAVRYGAVERTLLQGEQSVAAGLASAVGTAATLSIPVLGVAGPLLLAGGVVQLAALLVALRTLQRFAETGRIAPQADPVLIRATALLVSSLDDGVRGALLAERPRDLLVDDPAGPIGSERIGAVLAGLLLHGSGAPLAVVPTGRSAASAPRHLAELADRIPDGAEPGGQIRIERYGGADGTRWIVYIGGTVTFARDSGDEPFDLASDVLGVAHRPSDSERAVLQAMAQAGIGRDEPVLLVGHSQGALDAVRVAEDGGYRVGGVVGFGGPTGQIALPGDVPVLALEHDEDLVPALGGVAAAAAPGLRRVVVRRALPDGGFGTTTSAATSAFPAHDLGAYRRTAAAAEAAGDPRVRAFQGRIGPFLTGEDGAATRYRARRISPGPGPRADGGPARRSSR